MQTTLGTIRKACTPFKSTLKWSLINTTGVMLPVVFFATVIVNHFAKYF